jgi:hypothetical protein
VFDFKGVWVRLWRFVSRQVGEIDGIQRRNATPLLEYEIDELRNIFAVLLLGQMVGLPTAPLPLTFELMPYMEEEFELLMDKVMVSADPMGELFSLLDIG